MRRRCGRQRDGIPAARADQFAIDGSSSKSNSTPATPSTQPGVRYDGGPEEGSSLAKPAPNLRYDGGPEEGSSAASISGR